MNPQCLSKSGFYLYADDTCNVYYDKEVHKTEDILNKELSTLEQFPDKNL